MSTKAPLDLQPSMEESLWFLEQAQLFLFPALRQIVKGIENGIRIGGKADTMNNLARINVCKKVGGLATARKIDGHKNLHLNMFRQATVEANGKGQALVNDRISLKTLTKVLASLGALFLGWTIMWIRMHCHPARTAPQHAIQDLNQGIFRRQRTLGLKRPKVLEPRQQTDRGTTTTPN